MPYGFECYDETTGLLIFEMSDRLTKVLGILNPQGLADFSGSVTLTAAQLTGGLPFIFPMNTILYDIDNERYTATFSYSSGVTITPEGVITCDKINYPVMYGVY